jgi:hypothetical protein
LADDLGRRWTCAEDLAYFKERVRELPARLLAHVDLDDFEAQSAAVPHEFKPDVMMLYSWGMWVHALRNAGLTLI